MQDTGRGWFLRFIKPSPCMFVRTLTRVSECEALTYCMPGMCVVCVGCMSYVVLVCLCFSRALPIVLPVAMCVYSGVFELSLHMRGGEAEALIRLFYPYIRYCGSMGRSP